MLMASNRKNVGNNGIAPENSGVNCVEQEEERRYMRWSWKIEALTASNRKKTALTAFNRNSSGTKGVEL